MFEYIVEIFFFSCSGILLLHEISMLLKKAKFPREKNITPYLINSIRILGLVLSCILFVNIYLDYTGFQKEYEKLAYDNRMVGPIGLVYFFKPIVYLLLSQLFWIKILKNSRSVRFVFSLFLVAVPWVERWLLIIFTKDNEYLPTGWVYQPLKNYGILLFTICILSAYFMLYIKKES